MNNNLIAQIAKEWIDVKFRLKGYTKTSCDCAGLLVGILTELKIDSPFITHYHNNIQGNYINPKALLKALEESARPIAFQQIESGNLIAFYSSKQEPTHLAIVSNLQPLSIIHSFKLVNKVTETILDEIWINKIYQCYQLKI